MIPLDTQIWVRWVDPAVNPLPLPIIERIETGGRLAVSAASCWEVAWLARRGRLELKLDLDEWLDQALQGSQVECVPLDLSPSVPRASQSTTEIRSTDSSSRRRSSAKRA